MGVKRGRDIHFGFDRVFDHYAKQYEVFQHTTKKLIDPVLNGYNCTCFAYGATGSGKTYTMVGTPENPGVMVLTLKELYNVMETRKDTDFDVRISYLEIYNERIRDLLVPNSKYLILNDDENGCPSVSGLSYHKPKSADDILLLLQEGNKRRTQAFTNSNAQSSRSHAILQIIVSQKEKASSIESVKKIGKLSLIDLAGSERASRTKNRGSLLVEGANINKSLLALGNCINALGDGYKEGKYVPYRDSKLTRLLKDSLGGNCKTVMISNISPSNYCYEDTFNTLTYANRAKNIKTKVRVNEINVKVHVHEYKKVIENLKSENEKLKERISSLESNIKERNVSILLSHEKDIIDSIRKDIDHSINDLIDIEKELDVLNLLEVKLQEEKGYILKSLNDYRSKLEKGSSLKEIMKNMEQVRIKQLKNNENKVLLMKRLERMISDIKNIKSKTIKDLSERARLEIEKDLLLHWNDIERMLNRTEKLKQEQLIKYQSNSIEKYKEVIETLCEILNVNGINLSPSISDYISYILEKGGDEKDNPSDYVSPPSPFKINELSPLYKSKKVQGLSINNNNNRYDENNKDTMNTQTEKIFSSTTKLKSSKKAAQSSITPMNNRRNGVLSSIAKGMLTRNNNNKTRTPSFMRPTWSSMKRSVKANISSPYKRNK